MLAGATSDLLVDDLVAAACRHGIALEIVPAPYDQVVQQALDPASLVNTARPDAILVAVDHRWLRLDGPVLDRDAAQVVAVQMAQLAEIVRALQNHSGASAILQTLPIPSMPLFGSFDRRVRGSLRGIIDDANRALGSLAENTGSYLLDVAALAEQIGTDRWFDPVQWAAYKLPFSADCVPIYADHVGRLLAAIRGKTRKCLVLDLDNTIWGGVVGDDGVAGLFIGQGDARGEAFTAVQRSALELRERGIMLAVCSKNDETAARAPFREHPEMLLKEEHFAVFQANWIDKPSNLEAIARTLNIGLDSVVLLDDNPAERAQVRAALPEVAVPELPEDASWYAWYLRAAGYFEAIAFSAEDRGRVASYAADAQRSAVMAKARDLGEYLTSLEMKISFAPFDVQGRQRITQLINKTNQFNLTTRRYTEREVIEMENNPLTFTLQVRLADKFGDLGMIAILICRPLCGDPPSWEIDTWLMSCRVLGRKVEQAMLDKVAREAAVRGVRRLVGRYIPTAKNAIVAEHYGNLGFRRASAKDGGQTLWEMDVDTYSTPPLPMTSEDRFIQPASDNRSDLTTSDPGN
ncbi:MAG TPA: HAD-IIIC family phosphatase [Rhizomicrobium sp.]|nr:HAD-IIIC family phosphatase [Rhizomicrobium sp.]